MPAVNTRRAASSADQAPSRAGLGARRGPVPGAPRSACSPTANLTASAVLTKMEEEWI